jgi:dynein intermediate chain 2
MIFTKKGKTPTDRLLHLYKAHKGPVRAIHRNPMFVKNFLTCGDYQIRIFAEDCRESSIMWTPVGVSFGTLWVLQKLSPMN